MSTVAGILMASSLVMAAPSPGPVELPKEIFQELDYFVGNWTLEGLGAGGPMKSVWSLRWAPGKYCVLVEYSREEKGKTVRGSGAWGWDAVAKELVYHTFFSDAGVEYIRTKVEKPGLLRGKYAGSVFGKKVDAICELRKLGPDAWTFKTRGAAASGLGELDVRFARVKPGGPPKDDQKAFHAWGDYLVGGVWTSKDDKGQMHEDRWEWAVGKTYLHLVSKIDGKPSCLGPGGYDAQAGKFRYWLFNPDGVICQGVNTFQGGDFHYQHVGQGKNGPLSAKGKCVRITADQLREEVAERIVDGRRLPPATFIWSRTKAPSEGEPSALLREFGKAYVGNWDGVVQLDTDIPEVGKAGEKVPARQTIQWIWGGNGVAGEFQSGSLGMRWTTAVGPKPDELRLQGVWSDGSVGTTVVTRRGNQWRMQGDILLSGGRRRKETVDVTVSDAGNTQVNRFTNVFNGDEKRPDSTDVWKRR